MSDNIKIKIDEAEFPQLHYFATQVLGLEIRTGTNGPQLRAKIEQAAPGTTEIVAPPSTARAATAAVSIADAPAPQSRIPAGRAGQHFKYDPKVKLKIAPTSEPTRAREVQVSVNGEVVIIQRGKEVSIPYRHYLALDQAMEMVGVDTGEIHPTTGLPIIDFVSQHSYPFNVIDEPSEDEIAAWHARVDDTSIEDQKAA